MSNILGCDKIFLPNMKYKRLVVKEIVVKQIVLKQIVLKQIVLKQIVVKQIVLKQEGCNSWRVASFLFLPG